MGIRRFYELNNSMHDKCEKNIESEPLGEVQRDGALAESFPVGLEPQVDAYASETPFDI